MSRYIDADLLKDKTTRVNNIWNVITNAEGKGLDEIIDDIPSAQQWIPCSEGLPEDEQEIIFSTKTGRVHSGRYHDDNSANQWYSHRDRCRAWNNVVDAWMPLPEPYKGEES